MFGKKNAEANQINNQNTTESVNITDASNENLDKGSKKVKNKKEKSVKQNNNVELSTNEIEEKRNLTSNEIQFIKDVVYRFKRSSSYVHTMVYGEVL